MWTLILTLVIFLGTVLLLAGIALLTGRVLRGSCGGVSGEACVCSNEGQSGGSCELEVTPELIQIDVGVTAGRN
ncbi:MAG: hypothetical protein DRJ61_03745 [Acidobacteria bacterium]|nr:MAG: hypothetical protein DRJ61_03745 [Acidobacteriota bacterium]